MKEIAKSCGGPLQHHKRWKTQLRADDGDRSMHEHELLCMTLELSGCYDQLDLSALAGMELVVRRRRLVELRRMRVRGSLWVIKERELWWHMNWADTSQTKPRGGQRDERKAKTC